MVVLGAFSRSTDVVEVVAAIALPVELACCCNSSVGIFGTGFLLTLRTDDAVGLMVSEDDDVEQDADTEGPRHKFACASERRESLQSDDCMSVAADILALAHVEIVRRRRCGRRS